MGAPLTERGRSWSEMQNKVSQKERNPGDSIISFPFETICHSSRRRLDVPMLLEFKFKEKIMLYTNSEILDLTGID
jgi:hypothetical protein